jgi:hypothetical protein
MAVQRALTRTQTTYLNPFNGLLIENPVVDVIELTNEIWKLLMPEDFAPIVHLSASAQRRDTSIRDVYDVSRHWLLIKIKHRANMFIRAHSDVYDVDILQHGFVYSVFH